MPLFSSRRKSEANLRESANAAQKQAVPALPDKGSGGKERAPRSKSASRASSNARPVREREILAGAVRGWAPTEKRSRQNSGHSESGDWVLLDKAAPPQLPSLEFGSTAPRVAPRHAIAPSGGYATPPRRESSFASSSSAAHPTSPPPSSYSQLIASPPFFASTPPTSDGGHDGFSLDGPAPPPSSFGGHRREVTPQNGISQTFSTADSPSSSFIAPKKTAKHAQPVATAGSLPTSSSFYDSASPVASPQRRRDSSSSGPRIRASGTTRSREAEYSPSAVRTAATRRAENVSEGAMQRPARRESLNSSGNRQRPIASPSTPPSSARSSTNFRGASLSPTRAGATTMSPLAALSNASTAAFRQSSQLASAALSNNYSPPARAAYDPMAAFLGKSTATEPNTPSPAVSGASAFDCPIMGRGFSSPSNSSIGTPETSTNGEDGSGDRSLESPSSKQGTVAEPHKVALLPPIKLPPSSTVERNGPFDGPTPTQASFPPFRTAEKSPADAPVTESEDVPVPPRSVEKAVSTSSSAAPRSGNEQSRLPVRAVARKDSQVSEDPVSATSSTGKHSSRPALEESVPAVPAKPLTGLPVSTGEAFTHIRRPSLAAPAAPAALQSVAPRRLSQPHTTVLPVEPSRHTSLESTRLHKPLPSPLHVASFSSTPPLPSAAADAVSPRTPRPPPTPKSPRAVPPPLDLKSPVVSPGRKKITAEGTARAAALAAARDREKKVAAPAEGAQGPTEDAVTVALPIGVGDSGEQGPEELVHVEEEEPPRPRFEYALRTSPLSTVGSLLQHITYSDLISLRQVSKSLRRTIDVDAKELVLQRFLGGQGYRSFAVTAKKGLSSRYLPPPDSINLDIRDLLAFRASLTISPDEYALLARTYNATPQHFSPLSLKRARATTRAHNRVVLRLRSQSLLPPKAFAPFAFPDLAPSNIPVHKLGRAPSLKVWVPTNAHGESWMTDAEVVECEREVWRSTGAWAQLKKGDVVANVAIEPFGNVGKLVFDGRFLRDLSFSFDTVGHLPAWLNMLSFSPSYFHNIITSSSSNPVFYLSLAPFVASVRETLQLCNDRVGLSSPQGNTYTVKTFVYRAGIKIKPGQLIGDAAGVGGNGPGGIEVVHDDWAGQLVVETEGTTEHATMLIARVASIEPTPWRILRSKCRPGKLWLRPVLDSEAC